MHPILHLHDTPQRARRLDRPTVVQAALRLMDSVGVDGLTMRRLAEQLGVTPASLYRHVRDKDELLVLLADEIAGQVPLVRTDLDWRLALGELARGVRGVLLRHRDAARLVASLPPAGPRRLLHIEAILAVLLAAGFGAQAAAWSAYHFNNLVTESVADEVRMAVAAAAAGTTREALLAEGRAQLRSLPVQQYPSVVGLADDVAADDAAALFDFGVQLVLRGMETLLV
jgi:AcrR family transcriptional regulator